MQEKAGVHMIRLVNSLSERNEHNLSDFWTSFQMKGVKQKAVFPSFVLACGRCNVSKLRERVLTVLRFQLMREARYGGISPMIVL